MDSSSRIMELHKQLVALRINDWQEKVFSFQWFFLLFLLIVPWIIWWKLVEKKHIAEILSFGLLIAITASVINEICLQLLLWRAPYTLSPVPPRWFAPAFSYLPVVFMFIYQYFRTWKLFALATVVAAAVSAFVFQPILTWMGIFIMLKWNYFYSFLAFIGAGLGVRLLHQRIMQAEGTTDKAGTMGEMKGQPGFASPVLKKIIEKMKP